MAITTADGWFAAAKQKVYFMKNASLATTVGNPYSLWDRTGNPGAGTMPVNNITTGVLFTNATTGAPGINAFGSGATGYLAAGRYRNAVTGSCVLYDRIFGAFGQATNLASATPVTLSAPVDYSSRLPGGTDYGNLEILLEIVVTAASASTVTIGYTNQSNVTGRTAVSGTINGANFAANRIVSLPLQAGDTGVKAINSMTVGGTTSATGQVNVIVARRLAVFDIRIANATDAQAWDMIGGPVVFATSCLWPVIATDAAQAANAVLPTLDLDIING
jgi:hypothetical protein